MSKIYIYIAENCHRGGKPLGSNEKRIGVTKDFEELQREFDRATSPIYCSITAAWKTDHDEGKKIFSALGHILSDRATDTPEWYDDNNGTLFDRLSGFMNGLGYVPTGVLRDDDVSEYRCDEDDGDGCHMGHPTGGPRGILKPRVDLLVGEVFSYTYKGKKNVVRVDGPAKFTSLTDGQTYPSGSKAMNTYFRTLSAENTKVNINWWVKAKNQAGLSPNQVIKEKATQWNNTCL